MQCPDLRGGRGELRAVGLGEAWPHKMSRSGSWGPLEGLRHGGRKESDLLGAPEGPGELRPTGGGGWCGGAG